MAKRRARLPKRMGNWVITVKPSGRSGYVDGPRWSDSFICYDDGRTAFDFPERLPEKLKARIRKYCFHAPLVFAGSDGARRRKRR